ncbi:hypothetical protein DPSP01_011381 [Paraphaeosphaeria sporulosa]
MRQVHAETVSQEMAVGTAYQTLQVEEAVRAQQMRSLFGQERADEMAYRAGPAEEDARAQQVQYENHQNLEDMGKL